VTAGDHGKSGLPIAANRSLLKTDAQFPGGGGTSSRSGERGL
jgi:hypothetical protein